MSTGYSCPEVRPGASALHSADWLTKTITQKFGYGSAIVKAVPHCGLFFPSQPRHGVCTFPEYKVLGEHCPRFDNLASWYVERIVEHGAYADESCMAALHNPRQCWNAGIVARHVTTPLFFAQNRYDRQQMMAEMFCDECTDNETAISDKARGYMAYWGKQTESVLREFATGFNHSVYMPNCFQHGGNLCMKGGLSIDGYTFNTSLSDWFFNGIHHAHLDACGDFPCSKTCGCSTSLAEVVV